MQIVESVLLSCIAEAVVIPSCNLLRMRNVLKLFLVGSDCQNRRRWVVPFIGLDYCSVVGDAHKKPPGSGKRIF